MDPNQPPRTIPTGPYPCPGIISPGTIDRPPEAQKRTVRILLGYCFFIYYAVGRVSPPESTGTSRSDIFALCHTPRVICRGCNYLIARAEGGSKDKKHDIICRGILLTAARTLIFSLIVIAQLHCTIYW